MASTFFQRHCQGDTVVRTCDQTKGLSIYILEAWYGEVSCVPPNTYFDTSSAPCGTDVTDTVAGLCDNLFECMVFIDDATFGPTGCSPGQDMNLFLEYDCGKCILSDPYSTYNITLWVRTM